jgi:2-(1,2-epoxy-1,2-dihydrophenyl)acetyl-CoA isomerase
VSDGPGPWTLEQDGPLAVLTIDRPPLNLFDQEVFDGLVAAVERVRAEAPRGLLIRAEGRVWTGGVDVHMFQGLTPETGGDVWRRGLELIQAVEDLPLPVVFAAHALTLTWGFELALACDLVVAAESAYLLLAFVNIGLVPDGGSSLFVPARAGFTRAAEMAMLGEKVPAATAAEWNLVNRVVPDDEFAGAVEELAERLATGPTRSYAGTKRQLNRWLYAGMDDQLALEADIQQEMAASEDFREGVLAFVEKRKAAFGGR